MLYASPRKDPLSFLGEGMPSYSSKRLVKADGNHLRHRSLPKPHLKYRKFSTYVLLLLVIGIVVGFASTYFAGASAGSFDPKAINSGDTAWVLTASALVMLMTPARRTLLWGNGDQQECDQCD